MNQSNISTLGNTGSYVGEASSPEIKLWSAVLEQAIRDYALGIARKSQCSEYKSAYLWIFSENQVAKNSFNNICYLCNLNPDSVRNKLKLEPLKILRKLSNRKYDNLGG